MLSAAPVRSILVDDEDEWHESQFDEDADDEPGYASEADLRTAQRPLCGYCAYCKKEPGTNFKIGCLRKGAECTFIPKFPRTPDESVEQARTDLEKLLGTSVNDIRSIACETDTVWPLADLRQLFSGSSIQNFDYSWPGRPDFHRKEKFMDKSGTATKQPALQLQRVADNIGVVLFSAYHTAKKRWKHRRYTDEERHEIVRLLLIILGIPTILLEEFSMKAGKFSDVQTWMYGPGDLIPVSANPAHGVPGVSEGSQGEDESNEAELAEQEDGDTEKLPRHDDDAPALAEMTADPCRQRPREFQIREPKSRKEGSEYLYLMQGPNGLIKVGRTGDVDRRLRQVRKKFGPHTVITVWPKAGHLEPKVLQELKEYEVRLPSLQDKSRSIEHFNCSPETALVVIKLLDAAEANKLPKRTFAEAQEELDIAKVDSETEAIRFQSAVKKARLAIVMESSDLPTASKLEHLERMMS